MSRTTHYLHGGRVSCRATDIHHRRSPLVQGGLEIPAEVTIEMALTEENTLALKKVSPWNQLTGKFEAATAAILNSMKSDDDEISETDSDEDNCSDLAS